MASQPKTDRRVLRQKMVKNKVRLLNFYLSHGRDFLQEVLEVYKSPALLYEELIESDYYSSLTQADQDALYSIKKDNTFSDLELEQTFYLLTMFTRIKPPLCGWCGRCQVQSLRSDHIGENLEKFMSLWNVVNQSNFMADEIYNQGVQALKTLGDNVSSMFAFGKAFRKFMSQELEDNDKCPGEVQIVSFGKDVSVQIGQNNKCIMNVEVFDHLQKHEETGNKNAENDLVKMILHLNTSSTSGLYMARIEERILCSLSGEQLLEINEVLQEKFGVQIVVSRKGCIVLVIRKMKPMSQNLMDPSILGDFLSILFKLVGFSNEDLSDVNIQVDLTSGDSADVDLTSGDSADVDLTSGDSADVDLFKESQLKRKVLDVTLSKRYTIQRMSEERKKELVSTILEVADPNLADDSKELQIEAHFMNERVKHIRGYENSTSSKHTEKSPDGNSLCLSMESEKNPPFTPNAKEMKIQRPHCTTEYSMASSKNLPLFYRQRQPVEMNTNFFVNLRCFHRIILALFFIGVVLVLLNFANIRIREEISYQKPKPCSVDIPYLKDVWPTDRKLAIRNHSNVERLQSYRNKSAIYHLDLSCNHHIFINFSMFEKFSGLSHLNLSKNSIQRAVGLDLVPSLRFVDMSSNSLTSLGDLHTSWISHIAVLLLNNNHISILQSTDFSDFPFMKYVDVSNNPIQRLGLISTLPCCRIKSLYYRCVIQHNSVDIVTDGINNQDEQHHKQASAKWKYPLPSFLLHNKKLLVTTR